MTDAHTPTPDSGQPSAASDFIALLIFAGIAVLVLAALIWAVYEVTNDQYSSLDNVGFAATDETMREFLPGSFWRYQSQGDSREPETEIDIAETVFPAINLGAETVATIAASRDQRDLWATNDRDFICLSLYITESTARAVQLAAIIDNAAVTSGQSQFVRASNRTNILIVIVYSPRSNYPSSRSAFEGFVNRAPELIQ